MSLGEFSANAQSDAGEGTFVEYNNGNSAWSPDGEKIVFTNYNGLNDSLRRSLYVMDADRTNIRQLTAGAMVDDINPAWSPDGTKILFSRTTTLPGEKFVTQLCILDLESGAITSLQGSGMGDSMGKWSPDGSKIVFQASETTWPGSHIYVMNADGTNATRVTPPPTDLLYANYYPEWSPDGKKIAFGTAVGLGVVNPDGTGYRLFEGTKRSLGLSWTLDNKGIIFSRFLEDVNTYALYFINADGSGLKPLPAEEGAGLQYPELPRPSKDVTIDQEKLYRIADSAERMAAELAARPVQFVDPIPPELGNRKVAYVRGDGLDPEIWVVNLDGTGKKKLTENAVSDYNPGWSPDGERIAFVSNRDTNSKAFQIYTMNANGTDVKRLTNDPSFFDVDPVWSPDGKKIAFSRSNYEDGNLPASRLYVMNARDGTELRELTDSGGLDSQPGWSPDGSQIVYTSQRNNGTSSSTELFVINADGGEPRQLTKPVPGTYTFNVSPSWSPKGDKILFHNRDGVATINVNGSNLQVLFRSENTSDMFWSPDGSKIIFYSDKENIPASASPSFYRHYIMDADGTGLQGFFDDGDPLVMEQDLDIGPLVSGAIDKPPATPADVGNGNFCGKPSSEFDNVIVGTSGDDVLRGTDKNDLIRGLGGNDIIYGNGGKDCLKGDDGNDALWGGSGDDLLLGNNGNDRLVGDSGNDLLDGHAGNDNIWGGDGDDVMLGEAGADLLIGDNGNDRIWGGYDDDRILGEEGNDTIYGDNGSDRLYGQSGGDRLFGGSGDDMVVGGRGVDVLIGDGGNDRMWGSDSDDTLYDDEGDDLQNGGSGSDKCYDIVGSNTTYNCER